MNHVFDKIIIGAGLYGLYAAERCSAKGEKILVLEYDQVPFSRATFINQARVHMGYHYPRSLSTAVKSAGYFKRFVEDFDFCILQDFNQVYATSGKFSWTNANQFVEFCRAADIPCDEVPTSKYFKNDMCDGAFLTKEYTYDAMLLKKYYLEKMAGRENVSFQYGARVKEIIEKNQAYEILLEDGQSFETGFVLNATYASVNQILQKLKLKEEDKLSLFDIKYELCEIILCDVGEKLHNTGITVMDGPFFSIMPFGKTGYHSLTSVTFTPHVTSYESVPSFKCQINVMCSQSQLGNCSECSNKPESAWPYMSHLADKYLKPEYSYKYEKSLFSMKPILKASEVDDSRPTAIKVLTDSPKFISVLSGKINTVYDLDEFL